MNIAIIDDEPAFVETLRRYIIRICCNNGIEYKIDAFNNAKNIVNIYADYHLVFLDIDMPGTDGITALKELNHLDERKEFPYIAFVSGKENLVYEALKQFPYTFIRKSHLGETLESCVLNIYEKTNHSKTKYTIKNGRKTVTVFTKDIMYIEKINNYVWFHTVNGVYKERSTIEEKFSDLSPQNFVRTHIGYVVNLEYIYEISQKFIILDNGEKIPLSRKYYTEVNNKYYESLVIECD